MRTGSVKKYVIPNIPYLFVLWACLKLGTAYRLAAGADFPHKLMGLGQTVGPAFANLAPGLDPFDWLVGIVGAVGFRLLIYFKNKNAKKFRRDEEFGSARWGGPKDIAPFVDPVFENNVILTGTELLTMNPPQKSGQRPQPQRLCDRFVRLRQNPVLAHPAASPGQREEKGRVQLCGGRSKGRGSLPGGGFPATEGLSDQGVQFH